MAELGNTVVIHVAKYLDGNDRLCHHDCLFCMERMEPGNSNEFLPTIQEIDKALLNYSDRRNIISKIYIAGGEPTLRKDFDEIVITVKKYCDNIVLSTSCDYDNQDEMVEVIRSLGIKQVATSLHSHLPSIHDKLTGTEGSFERTMSSIKKLIDVGISVTVNSVINAYNVTEMQDIVECFSLRQLKIEKLTLTHYMNHGNAYYHKDLKFDVDECSEEIGAAISSVSNVDYDVTFRDFPICADSRLEWHMENVEYIDIIDLNTEFLEVVGEQAPSFTKEKCCHCDWFDKCPHYLMANYGEE